MAPQALEKSCVEVGFIPTLCATPLFVAHADGHFAKRGLEVKLRPAPGWGGIRQRLAFGKLDAAHVLSPMPLAARLGIDGRKTDLRLAAIQNVNGQAIALRSAHAGIESPSDLRGMTFGVPDFFSTAYYLLCHFLAEHGIDPLSDVTIVEVSPPAIPMYLERGWLDGILSSEPYNQIAVDRGVAFIYRLSKDIWPGHPCCAFACRASFVRQYPRTYSALREALSDAQLALHDASLADRQRTAEVVCRPSYLGLDEPRAVEQVLTGIFHDGQGARRKANDRIDYLPRAHEVAGVWMLSQMQRWQQLTARVDYEQVVREVFDRPSQGEDADAVRKVVTKYLGFDGRDAFAFMRGQPFSAFVDRVDAPDVGTPPAVVRDRDVAERRRLERALEVANRSLRDLIETVPLGWAVHEIFFDNHDLPVDMVWRDANQAFERFTGLSRERVLNQRATEVIPGIRQAELDVISVYGAVLRNQQAAQHEFYFAPFDKWYRLVAFPAPENRVGVFFEDISDRRMAAQQLESLNEQLIRSNAELEQFAYVASHDLQEPLRMVASYTQLLAKKYQGQLDEKADRYIEHAVSGAHRMQRLISDLLAFSRVGKTHGAKQTVDTAEVVDEVMRGLQAVLKEKRAEVRVLDLPKVEADPTQLEQVFQNLLSNALKFCGDQPPSVQVSGRDEGHGWAAISVSDHGIGIDERYHRQIFEIFQRLHPRHEYDGTGIGLAVVKKIIEGHGGQIRVESQPGQGACFTFTLRTASSAEP